MRHGSAAASLWNAHGVGAGRGTAKKQRESGIKVQSKMSDIFLVRLNQKKIVCSQKFSDISLPTSRIIAQIKILFLRPYHMMKMENATNAMKAQQMPIMANIQGLMVESSALKRKGKNCLRCGIH